MLLHELPPGPKPPAEIAVIVEVPKGSRNKYEYDKHLGVIYMDRRLFSPVHYPGDYGFIPSTLADDGDPLDVVVLTQEPSFSGCMLYTRPLGMLMMTDEKGGDEKILAVPIADPNYDTYQNLGDVPPHFLREMDHFFRVYKELEGKPVTSVGWKDRWEAEQVIQRCIEAFKG
ncbi:inorganic diphosphatase [bacterium]|nr:inorganic diphosphatase [bacterium]MBU1638674.1 inorganic diphosphatase [bacterium]MBU1920848.1 inorganic diphosphatase [bacterium]